MSSRPVLSWVIASFSAIMIVVAWVEYFSPLSQTRLGISLAPAGAQAVVTAVDPHSAAAAHGVVPGDRVLLSQMTFSQRVRLELVNGIPGASLSIPVEARNGAVSQVTLLRMSRTYSDGERASYVVLALIATVTLLITGFIGARRPSLATAALAYYGIDTLTSARVATLFSPAPDPYFGAIAFVVVLVISSLPQFALIPFITRFPNVPSGGSRHAWMRAGDIVFVLYAVYQALEILFEPMTFRSWSFNVFWITPITGIIVLIFAIAAYLGVSGEERRRIGWVTLGYIVTAGGATASNILDSLAGTGGSLATTLSLISQLCVLALPLALAYAVLRHRVIDVGFVINRTVVYGVLATLIIGLIGLADWATSRLIVAERLADAVEAAITVAIGFGLHWLRARIEDLVDRVIFRKRHIAERRIEHRIHALDYAETRADVDDAVAVDAATILELSAAALFTFDGECFVLQRSTNWNGRVTSFATNDLLVRTLRSEEKAVYLDDAAIKIEGAPADLHLALALPIISHHDLRGFAVYGNHRDGSSLDPDETALLERLAHAAGSAYLGVEYRLLRVGTVSVALSQ